MPRLLHRPSGSQKGARYRRNMSQASTNHLPIRRDTRLFVWSRDGGRCRNCGAQENLQFDHIIPKSVGGSSVAENVEVLCRGCNLKKGARLFAPNAGREYSGDGF